MLLSPSPRGDKKMSFPFSIIQGTKNIAANLTSPSGGTPLSTSTTVSVTTDLGSGTLYWIVSSITSTPSVTQIKAGQMSNGSAAPSSGNQVISSTGSKTGNATGLTAATSYTVFFYQQGPDGSVSVIVSAAFTTAAGSGLLTFTKTFDTNTGSRASPGSSFGTPVDATLANNFFNAVDEACNILAGKFCNSAFTLAVQFGYSTVNNSTITGGAIAENDSNGLTQTVTYANWKSALGTKASTSQATTFQSNLPASAQFGNSNILVQNGYAAWLGLATPSTPHFHMGLGSPSQNGGFNYTWTQVGGTTAGTVDAVGAFMHEITEGMGRFWNLTQGGLFAPMAGNYSKFNSANTFSTTQGSSQYISLDKGTTNLYSPGFTATSGDAFDIDSSTGYSGDIVTNATLGITQLLTTATKQWLDCNGWQWNGT